MSRGRDVRQQPTPEQLAVSREKHDAARAAWRDAEAWDEHIGAMHVAGTDELRMIAYMCDGESLEYFIDRVWPALVNYSEIECLALAGAFVGQRPEQAASFIAFYAQSLLGRDEPTADDDPSRQSPVGTQKSKLPNPDPAVVWEKWRASQQDLKRWVDAIDNGTIDTSQLEAGIAEFAAERDRKPH
jgi:hypothetical protein